MNNARDVINNARVCLVRALLALAELCVDLADGMTPKTRSASVWKLTPGR